MKLGRLLRDGSALLILPGLLFALPGAAGTADTLKHGRRDVGTATLFDRSVITRCGGGRTGGCHKVPGVRVRIDGARDVGRIDSPVLYRLVGPGDGTARARLQEDTFTHKIGRARVNGHWYVIREKNKAILALTIPLLVLGVVLLLAGLVGLARAILRRIVGRTPRRRWVRAIAGAAVFAFCVALTSAGLSGDRFPVGPGELFGAYARFTSTGLHEGVSVRITQFGTVHRAESPELFALMRTPTARVAVDDVEEDSAGEVTAVTYRGRSYVVDRPEDWLALIVVVPIALVALAALVLNARALMRARKLQHAGG